LFLGAFVPLETGEIVFWLTLFFGALVGEYVSARANPPVNGAIWAVFFPLVFIVVAYVVVMFFLETAKSLRGRQTES
jgi:hypothetical protein